MLKIRLSQTGKKHKRTYRIVVAEARSKRGGRAVAQIGYYLPNVGKFVINRKEYERWQKLGAIPTETVIKLVNEKAS